MSTQEQKQDKNKPIPVEQHPQQTDQMADASLQQMALGTTIQRAKLDPNSLKPRDVSQLQGAIGNQAVNQLLMRKAQQSRVNQNLNVAKQKTNQPIQAKLNKSTPLKAISKSNTAQIQRSPFDKALDDTTLEATAENMARIYIKGIKADTLFKEHANALQAHLGNGNIEVKTRPMPKAKGNEDPNKSQEQLNKEAMDSGKVFVSGGLQNLPEDLQNTAMKGIARAAWKVIVKYNQEAEQLTDISAISLVFPDLQTLAISLDSINTFFGDRDGLALVSSKNRFGKDFGTGYRDMLLNLQVGDHLVELQIHLSEFMEAKGGKGHKMYKEFRDVNESFGLVVKKLISYLDDRLKVHQSMAKAYDAEARSTDNVMGSNNSNQYQDRIERAINQKMAHLEAISMIEARLAGLREKEDADTSKIDKLAHDQTVHYDGAGLKSLRNMLKGVRSEIDVLNDEDIDDNQFTPEDYQALTHKQDKVGANVEKFRLKRDRVVTFNLADDVADTESEVDESQDRQEVKAYWNKIAGFKWTETGGARVQPLADYSTVDSEYSEVFEQIKQMSLVHLTDAQNKAKALIYGE